MPTEANTRNGKHAEADGNTCLASIMCISSRASSCEKLRRAHYRVRAQRLGAETLEFRVSGSGCMQGGGFSIAC